MPFDIATFEHQAAVNEGPYLRVVQSRTSERTLARHHDECCMAGTTECWPFERAAFPTNEEIRSGSELRLRLRERYLRRPQAPIGPWCVGVD